MSSSRVIRSYHPGPLVEGQTIALQESASHHLLKVLRLSVGDELVLFNGEGGEYPATLVQAPRGRPAQVQLGAVRSGCPAPALQLELLQGMARGERMDYAVQKGSELGMGRFWPIASRYSEPKLSAERLPRRLAHWQQVAISACEQSHRCEVPVIESLHQLDSLPSRDWGCALVLDPDAALGWAEFSASLSPVPRHFSLAVGPVGGWHAEELDQWVALGFTRIRLGPRVLRTETAGPAMMAALQALFGDWR